jgi:hypothetical protein
MCICQHPSASAAVPKEGEDTTDAQCALRTTGKPHNTNHCNQGSQHYVSNAATISRHCPTNSRTPCTHHLPLDIPCNAGPAHTTLTLLDVVALPVPVLQAAGHYLSRFQVFYWVPPTRSAEHRLWAARCYLARMLLHLLIIIRAIQHHGRILLYEF